MFARPLTLLLTATTVAAQVPGLTGTVIVTNKAPGTATIVDVGTGRTLAALPTGNGPHEIVASRDGSIAVVTDYGTGPAPGSTLTVIDIPGLKVARTVNLAPYARPHGIAFLPGDSLVAVTSESTQNVVIVNVRSGEVVNAISTTKTGSHMVGVTADGSRGWTGDMGSNTVTELDLRSGRVLRHIEVPTTPEAINVTADGSEAWVGSNATGKVSVVSARTGSVTTAAEGLGWPYRVFFSPDSRLAMIPDYRNEELRFLDRASRSELGRLKFTGGGPQGIAGTPDGRYVLLSLSREGRVVVIEVAKRAVAGSVLVGETPDGVAYTARVVVR
jgi:YVTN family beta-propeller protein